MEIPKDILLDNTDLYEIPEDRRQAMIDAPENKRRTVSDKELDIAFKKATGHFEAWKNSINEEYPEGDKSHLGKIQDEIETVDRVLAFKYTDVMGKPRQMIFKPARLHNLNKATLENRLELQ